MGSVLQFLGVLLLLHLCAASSSVDSLRPEDQSHADLRVADVERQCESVLTSAAELGDDAYRASRVKRELAFKKGDWRQDAGHAPLMPFDGSDVASGGARGRLLEPLPLATFVITHFDDENRARTAVNVSGVLVLSISRKNRDPEIRPAGSSWSPEFKMSPGSTKLKIVVEGVYVERDDGERILCMVGSALLPTRGADPWDWAKNSGRSGFLPPVTSHDSILLVLRYPKERTLKTQAVLGEMRSTSSASSAAYYFDTVKLVSRLRWSSYQYRSDDLVAGACSPLPSIDAVDSRSKHRYKDSFLCQVLELYGYGHDSVVTALQNQHCNSTATTCRSLGPFEMDRALDQDEIARTRIAMQDLNCYIDAAGTVRVSAVFRAVPPWEDRSTAEPRSGISGTTLFAEGVWVASAGQACLVASRGTGSMACDLRVCLYMPMTFSVTGRSIMLGRITSVVNTPAGEVADDSSLSFMLGLSLPRFWITDGEQLAFTYSYTKVERAVELLRRSEPSTVRKIIKKLLSLRYPRADHYVGDGKRSLAHLANVLVLRFTSVPSMFAQEWIERSALQLEIVFLGQVSHRFTAASAAPSVSRMSSGKLLVNVSGELTFVSQSHLTSSVMSLEGVYSPEDGWMHLIGCRDLRLRWRNLSTTSGDLEEEGMDCSIEVRIQYPPWNTHWLIWWTAKVEIASARNAGDPLRFDTMELQAVPFQFPQVWRRKLNGGLANGVLCIVLLSAVIAAELSQLRHLKTHPDAAPYVSLVMLGLQALGFAMPLAIGIEALRAWVAVGPDDMADYALLNSRAYQSMDKAVKVLSFAALVLVLRLCQKVWRARERVLGLLSRRSVPGDAKVFVFHSAVLAVVFVLVLVLNGEAAMTVMQHVGLMQDVFLLPQVIGNAAWRVNGKPLAERYYLGVTAARLLPHVYDYVRPPVAVGYSLEPLKKDRWFVRSDAGDVGCPSCSGWPCTPSSSGITRLSVLTTQ